MKESIEEMPLVNAFRGNRGESTCIGREMIPCNMLTESVKFLQTPSERERERIKVYFFYQAVYAWKWVATLVRVAMNLSPVHQL